MHGSVYKSYTKEVNETVNGKKGSTFKPVHSKKKPTLDFKTLDIDGLPKIG